MKKLKVGFTYDAKADYELLPGDPPDKYSEFDIEETLSEIENAIRSAGYNVERIGNAKKLLEKIILSKGIYQVGTDDIFNLIFGIKDNVDSLMIVGHNPTLTQFANLFLEEMIELLPTSGIISINFEADSWNDIIKAPHKTNFNIFPKQMN